MLSLLLPAGAGPTLVRAATSQTMYCCLTMYPTTGCYRSAQLLCTMAALAPLLQVSASQLQPAATAFSLCKNGTCGFLSRQLSISASLRPGFCPGRGWT